MDFEKVFGLNNSFSTHVLLGVAQMN